MPNSQPMSLSLAGAVPRLVHRCLLTVLSLLLALQGAGLAHAQNGNAVDSAAAPSATSGPIRLRQGSAAVAEPRYIVEPMPEKRPVYQPGEFERFVQRQAGTTDLQRFGADLMSRGFDTGQLDASPLVPPDYPVAPGDEILLTIWGSVDADLRLIVDRAGRITIPRVGAVAVAGVRQSELADTISRRVAQVFKNYELSVSLGALRGIRVYVTGFTASPGSYTVSSLSTIDRLAAHRRSGLRGSAGVVRPICAPPGLAVALRGL